MLEHITEWLSKSQLHYVFSDTTRLETFLIIPVSQTLHILAVSVVMISIALLNLRLLGIGGKRQSFGLLAHQLIPWIWGALLVLLATGIAQTIAEPARELMNTAFRIKMVLLAVMVAITLVYQRTVFRAPNFWDASPQRRRMAHMLAGVSLTMWFTIAALGRVIAYWG